MREGMTWVSTCSYGAREMLLSHVSMGSLKAVLPLGNGATDAASGRVDGSAARQHPSVSSVSCATNPAHDISNWCAGCAGVKWNVTLGGYTGLPLARSCEVTPAVKVRKRKVSYAPAENLTLPFAYS